MKINHLTGFGVSSAIHAVLALLLVPVLFAEAKQPEEPPVLPVELSMFEPQAPAPAPQPVPQVTPEPPPPPPPPPPKPREKPKEKPKPKQEKKKVEKPLPKPKPEKDLRKEREERERREELQRQREEQQRLEDLRRQEQARAEAERQARQRAQQEAAARAAAQARNEVPVITNPRYRRPPRAPDYPRRAMEAGVEGTVIVRANVSPGGSVTSTRVHRSSGNSTLDSAALKAVRGWSFVPATRGGQNIASIVQVPVRFRLK